MRFIPRPVVVGFTNGIAVLIASTQVRIPGGLPHGAFPAFHPALLPGLIAPAVTVALLGAIEELADLLHRSGRDLILCGARYQPSQLIARADFHRRVGDANICPNIREALERARQLHDARVEKRPA